MTPLHPLTSTPSRDIQSALDVLMKGRTSFVIAQRISTVMNADKIIVLEKGKVVAEGKHAQLMEDEPHLRRNL
jgi:ATP-binding cassette subfamily B multidrug efflux pump